MSQIFFATGNMGKKREVEALLAHYGVEVLTIKDFPDYVSPEETGDTFLKNATIKAKAGYEHTGLLSLADDSGLCVDPLSGAPGVYSSRYGGEEGNDKLNNEKLLAALSDVPDGKRSACFKSVIVLYGDGVLESSQGVVEGDIIHEYRGDGGFGYDPIFQVKEFGLCMSEISVEDKNKISHRGKALVGIIKKVLENLNK